MLLHTQIVDLNINHAVMSVRLFQIDVNNKMFLKYVPCLYKWKWLEVEVTFYYIAFTIHGDLAELIHFRLTMSLKTVNLCRFGK